MTIMDISESGFQTPAGKKRKALGSPSPPLASQPTTSPSSYKNMTPLIATGYWPKVYHANSNHEQSEAVPSKSQNFPNQAVAKTMDFHRRIPKDFAIL